jgi:hypothetical protein
MPKKKPAGDRHVNRVVNRHGRAYYYHRVTGERLPDDRDARRQRVLELNDQRARDKPRPGKPAPGTWARLIDEYKADPEYTDLGDETRRGYDRHLEAIRKVWGQHTVKSVKSKNVRSMRNRLAKTPRAANLRVAVLSILFNAGRAFDEDAYGAANPAAGMKKLKAGDGYKPWPEHVYEEAIEAAYPELRHAIVATGNLGQRGGDMVRLARTQLVPRRQPERCQVTQRKTGEVVEVPLTAELLAELPAIPVRGPLLLTTKRGLAWSEAHLRHELQKLMEEIGHEGYTLHGLRFRAAQELFAAGATVKEVSAVTGHRTAAMALQYIERRASAKSAVEKLDKARAARHNAGRNENS